MLLSAIASVFSAFLIAQSANAALTQHQVVTNIETVARFSTDTSVMLSGLSTNTSPSQVRMIGQMVANNIKTIVKDLSGDVSAMQATPPFSNGVTQPIVDALRNFVSVHQELLSIVIGKHTIFAQFYLTAPIVVVLGSLEAMIDTFSFALIDIIPSRKNDVVADRVALHGSVHESLKVYMQTCVSSPLYPKQMPICIAL